MAYARWTYDMLAAEAQKYGRRSDFATKTKNVYARAHAQHNICGDFDHLHAEAGQARATDGSLRVLFWLNSMTPSS
ncbi:hypothetical protein ACMAZE_12665 [Pseudopelagicola sp. nBUS_20]|uniref:hypothetical protein n=1 Tax=Pseudopelagicola sp. nBUS_20 TaxID=3395317 RepID=UPI003EB90AB7